MISLYLGIFFVYYQIILIIFELVALRSIKAKLSKWESVMVLQNDFYYYEQPLHLL